MNSYVLGIDIGTTSVKVCLVDVKNKDVVASQKKDTYSDVPSELGSEGNKQDVPRILSALQMCVSRLPKDKLKKVVKIGVCGQMHGCMLWKQGDAWERKSDPDRFEVKETSHLYTWQDNRCTQQFLSGLPVPQAHLAMASGFGCATLLWFAKNKPEKLDKYDRAGTIHDFLVCMLCDLEKPIMSVQNSAAWGYFNTVKLEWNFAELQNAGLPTNLLPDVVKAGEIAGKLKSSWYNIPVYTPVLASLGDLQCSVLPLLLSTNDAVINISTSAQLSFKMPNAFIPSDTPPDTPQPIEYFPYFEDSYLAVAASLNGGNALAAFARTLQQWSLELGFQVPQSKIWERTLSLGMEDQNKSSLIVEPTLFGERHNPQRNASVLNIDLGNISLGKVMRALCKGIIENLYSMMPGTILRDHEIKRIIGGGSALMRNPILQKELECIYQLPVTLDSRGDAAYGAALVAVDSLKL